MTTFKMNTLDGKVLRGVSMQNGRYVQVTVTNDLETIPQVVFQLTVSERDALAVWLTNPEGEADESND